MQMLRYGRLSIACGMLGLWSAASWGVPPKVVRAMPDNADVGIDPALTEMTIEFDQEMSPGGKSICGRGETFPTIEGEIRWTTARTMVVPVQLEAGRQYSLSINCASARNFRSVAGESADAYPISFRTARAGESAAVLTPEEAAGSARELRKAIDERYAYRDRVVKDWDAVFAEHREVLEGARTASQFARAAVKVLAAAEDPHVTVRVGEPGEEFVLGTHRRVVDANVNMNSVSAGLSRLEKKSNTVFVGRVDETIGYVLVASWTGEDTVRRASEEIRSLAAAGVTRLVLDVRPNSGGDEVMAQQVAGYFVDEPRVYSKNRYRAADEPGGYTQVFDRVLQPVEEQHRYRGRVAVLMGRANMSSCESFLLMMRESPRARLFGERSYGSSGNPKPVELSCGVRVVLSSWQDFTAAGAAVEGVGISPDVEVTATQEQLRTSDPVLEAAVRWLREPAQEGTP